MEAFRHLDLHVPEQLIEVPKISSPGSLGADGGTVGGSAGIRAVGCSVMVRTCWSEMVAAIVTTTKTNGGKHREGLLGDEHSDGLTHESFQQLQQSQQLQQQQKWLRTSRVDWAGER